MAVEGDRVHGPILSRAGPCASRFLRSETSLIQTIGRAARNIDGKVILYADTITNSMERATAETSRRRDKQAAWNLPPANLNILERGGARSSPEEWRKS